MNLKEQLILLTFVSHKDQIGGCFLSYHLEPVNFCSRLSKNTTWRIMESKLPLFLTHFLQKYNLQSPNSSSQGLFRLQLSRGRGEISMEKEHNLVPANYTKPMH